MSSRLLVRSLMSTSSPIGSYLRLAASPLLPWVRSSSSLRLGMLRGLHDSAAAAPTPPPDASTPSSGGKQEGSLETRSLARGNSGASMVIFSAAVLAVLAVQKGNSRCAPVVKEVPLQYKLRPSCEIHELQMRCIEESEAEILAAIDERRRRRSGIRGFVLRMLGAESDDDNEGLF